VYDIGMAKKRLDVLLVEQGLSETRQKAQAMIMAGNVLVNDKPAEKAGALFDETAEIRFRGDPPKYVSRGGDKLEGALDVFKLDVSGLDALDVGASTGGFTDCLLQHGARSVCAIDVGYGQLANPLRNDPRVTVFEKTNARNLTQADLGNKFDIITIDVSFISLLKVLPALVKLLNSNGAIAALVKPQFEAGRENVGKGGVVRDPAVHEIVLRNIIEEANKIGLRTVSLTHSPLPGPKGNIEFFALLKFPGIDFTPPDPEVAVKHAHKTLNIKNSIDT
jgi:23S rRNA (cytidine1920-2'-O)/16S rRNA (cytidine1409-2'-O)-methyltransferase